MRLSVSQGLAECYMEMHILAEAENTMDISDFEPLPLFDKFYMVS